MPGGSIPASQDEAICVGQSPTFALHPHAVCGGRKLKTLLVGILILATVLAGCTSEPAPTLPQANTEPTPQATATTVSPTEAYTEIPVKPATLSIHLPTVAPERPATATQEPTPTTEPTPTAAPPAPTVTTAPTATPTVDPHPPTPAPTSPPPSPTAPMDAVSATLRLTVSAIPTNLPVYDRHDWKHWTDADGDCQDARQEVLVAESQTTVSFRTDRRCRVTSGQWLAPYSNTVVTDPGKLDIDHMVPLGNAHLSGAWQWSAQQRERYANYLADPQHLIAVTASANRSKGARGPEAWKPEDRAYWCQYAVDWITIKKDWNLTVTTHEHRSLVEMLNTCANPPQLTVSHRTQTRPTPAPTRRSVQPTPKTRTYASCDAAQAAGEPRIQGSKGGGRGFPSWMVPSARDGDGDGVVCER